MSTMLHRLIVRSSAVALPMFAAGYARADLRVTFSSVPGAVALTDASVYADPADPQPAGIAARMLADDVGRVAGRAPRAVVGDAGQLGHDAVLVGTLGHCPLVDRLVADGKIRVDDLRGKEQAYRLAVVDHPLSNVDRALVIVGSDRRGTAYGVADLSARIGVSPWYWWANVPVPHHDAVYVSTGGADGYTAGSPTVRYRGIFLNDEAPALTGWSKERFGGLNSKMYTHMFELLLRLRANYLWPAMWSNAFNEDDPQNPKLANDYGIVMGTSHQEPMMRSQKEFDKRFKPAEWNYATHPDLMERFWREGVRRNRAYDNLVTIGMRGRNDTPMLGEGASQQQSMDLLERIVAVQRKILAAEVNPDVTKVPQVWCLYKEVQGYYEHGLRVPDDVTLLWSDDNWGDIRRLPTPDERKRSGGAGVYYHFDYVGDPRNYKWINTNQIAKVWEQMTLAHAYGADRVWVVNVGDLKPMELPINFFMDLAWNPDAMTVPRLSEYTRDWAAAQFGPEHAAEAADLIDWYTRTNARRKPELLTDLPYSVSDYHEADAELSECRAAFDRADALAKAMPADARDAFFQLVEHPVKATAVVNTLYIKAAMNRLYATQGRAGANGLADQVADLFKEDQALSDRYNHGIAGGFWDHMMDQVHIGYTSWNDPRRDVMPKVERLQPAEAAGMGVAVEGSADAWPGGKGPAVLPAFDAINRQVRTIDVFDRGRTPFPYAATADQPWVTIDKPSGTVDQGQRLRVGIDWAHAPAGPSPATATITIKGPGSESVRVAVSAVNPTAPTRDNLDGFAEDAGEVAMQASHYSRKVDGSGVSWGRVDDLGLTGSAMALFPRKADSVVPAAGATASTAPCLEYRIFTDRPAGTAAVTLIVSPTQNFVPGRGLRYAVVFDDQPLQVVDSLPTTDHRAWQTSVKDGVRRSRSTHPLAAAGYHTLKVYMVDPGLVLQRIVVDLGGLQPSYLGPPESFHRNTN